MTKYSSIRHTNKILIHHFFSFDLLKNNQNIGYIFLYDHDGNTIPELYYVWNEDTRANYSHITEYEIANENVNVTDYACRYSSGSHRFEYSVSEELWYGHNIVYDNIISPDSKPNYGSDYLEYYEQFKDVKGIIVDAPIIDGDNLFTSQCYDNDGEPYNLEEILAFIGGWDDETAGADSNDKTSKKHNSNMLDWKKEYINILNGFTINEELSDETSTTYENKSLENEVYYTESAFGKSNIYLVDITDCGIPEMLFFNEWNVYVFSCVNGELNYYEISGHYGFGCSEKDGIIYGTTGGTGVLEQFYYDISGGELKCVCDCGYNYWKPDDPDYQYFFWDDNIDESKKVNYFDTTAAEPYKVTESQYTNNKENFEKEHSIRNLYGTNSDEGFSRDEAIEYINNY